MYKNACRFMQRSNHPNTHEDSLAIPDILRKGVIVSPYHEPNNQRYIRKNSDKRDGVMAAAFKLAGFNR